MLNQTKKEALENFDFIFIVLYYTYTNVGGAA
jgi:hypothetical protein